MIDLNKLIESIGWCTFLPPDPQAAKYRWWAQHPGSGAPTFIGTGASPTEALVDLARQMAQAMQETMKKAADADPLATRHLKSKHDKLRAALVWAGDDVAGEEGDDAGSGVIGDDPDPKAQRVCVNVCGHEVEVVVRKHQDLCAVATDARWQVGYGEIPADNWEIRDEEGNLLSPTWPARWPASVTAVPFPAKVFVHRKPAVGA